MKRWQVMLICVAVSIVVNACIAVGERAVAGVIHQKCKKVQHAESIA